MQFNDVIFRNYHIALLPDRQEQPHQMPAWYRLHDKRQRLVDITDKQKSHRDIIQIQPLGQKYLSGISLSGKVLRADHLYKNGSIPQQQLHCLYQKSVHPPGQNDPSALHNSNNTIQNQCDTSCTMRMCIHIADTAMGCPTCMTNTANTIHRISLPYLFKVLLFRHAYGSAPGRLSHQQLPYRHCHNHDTPAVQCIKNLLCNTLFACITYYSTHNFSSLIYIFMYSAVLPASYVS